MLDLRLRGAAAAALQWLQHRRACSRCDVSHSAEPAVAPQPSFGERSVCSTHGGSGSEARETRAKVGAGSRDARRAVTATLLTFFFAGSVTPWTMRLSSLRIALAATPVVADLKSCLGDARHRREVCAGQAAG